MLQERLNDVPIRNNIFLKKMKPERDKPFKCITGDNLYTSSPSVKTVLNNIRKTCRHFNMILCLFVYCSTGYETLKQNQKELFFGNPKCLHNLRQIILTKETFHHLST